MIFLVAVFAFGLMIGGFVSGNVGFGIIGLLAFLGISIFGIVRTYLRRTENVQPESVKMPSEQIDELFAFVDKLKRISQFGSYTRELFSYSEIVSVLVNLIDAQRNLTNEEYRSVVLVYNAYMKKDKQIELGYDEFCDMYEEIIISFDMIAPFYKFCTKDGLISRDNESIKEPIRREVRKVVEDRKVFGREWNKMHELFEEDFCADYFYINA